MRLRPWVVASFSLALTSAAACAPDPIAPPPASPTPTPAPNAPTSTRAAIRGAEASPITFERMAKFPEPGWNIPRAASFSPDGKVLTYLASETGTDEMVLYGFDLQSKTTKVLLRSADLLPQKGTMSREEELRRERQRQRAQGITSYQWAKKKNRMLVPLGGDLFLREESGKTVRLTDTKEAEIDGKICATGEKVAYVRGSELFAMDVTTRRESPLTTPKKDATHGLSDYNGQEEFDEESGFFWAPTCDKIVYLEVNEKEVGTVSVIGYRNGAPDSMLQKYPEVGRKNPSVKVGILDLKGKKTTWVNWPDATENYYGRFHWAADGKWLLAQRVSRDQKTIDVVRIDAATGKANVLFTSKDPAWVSFMPLHLLEKADRFVVLRDVGGHDHLELRDAASGSLLRKLTSGSWDVTEIVAIDEERRRVVFEGTKDGVLGRQLFTAPLDGGEMARLAPESGVHHAIAERTASAFLDVHSAADRVPRAVIRDAQGAEIGELPIRRDSDLDALRIRPPKFVTVQSHGVELEGALLEPRDMKEGIKYPVVVMVYGGPGVQTVLDRYTPRLQWQHLADRGFVVFQLDNRGSEGRGHAFEAPIAGHLGEVELEDQLAGAAHLKTLPFVDPERIGIYGHSYGGFMALAAMLRAPGTFKVGIAGSPVTDWRLYDTGYTERFMGLSDRNKAGYDGSDLLPYAKDLRGDLLLVHALMDENVHFANTARLIDAFVAADKHFDFFLFPGERHGYRSPAVRAYAAHCVVDYLAQHL